MKPHMPTDPAALRRAAEAQVKQRRATKPPLTKADLNRLQHELEVHQIELELRNENLQATQDELHTALERYTDLYDFAPVGYLTLGPDGEIRQLNFAAATLLGTERSRLVNRRLGQFIGRVDQVAFADFLEGVFTGQQSGTCEVSLAEGAPPLFFQLDVASLPSGQECLAVLTNITERKRAEDALRSMALQEKTVLLKEVHHRVKNNLQIVISLLNLQSKEACPDAVRNILATTQNRVRSMAFIHENLYQSENLAHLNLGNYLENLCAHLLRFAGPVNARVAIESQVKNERISIGLNPAVPCGLLINELVTNALKHAFPGERPGLIRVTVQQSTPQEVCLTVADDGVGLPAALDPHHPTSLGLRLVCLLTKQLHGTVTFERGPGTTVQILFPNLEKSETANE